MLVSPQLEWVTCGTKNLYYTPNWFYMQKHWAWTQTWFCTFNKPEKSKKFDLKQLKYIKSKFFNSDNSLIRKMFTLIDVHPNWRINEVSLLIVTLSKSAGFAQVSTYFLWVIPASPLLEPNNLPPCLLLCALNKLSEFFHVWYHVS